MSKQRRWIKKHHRAERKDQALWERQQEKFFNWYTTNAMELTIGAINAVGAPSYLSIEKFLRRTGLL